MSLSVIITIIIVCAVCVVIILLDKKLRRGDRDPLHIVKQLEEELAEAESTYGNAYIPEEMEKADKKRREIVERLSTEFSDYTEIDYRAYTFSERKLSGKNGEEKPKDTEEPKEPKELKNEERQKGKANEGK